MQSKADVSQLNLPHGTENENRKIRKRNYKTETDMLRRNDPVIIIIRRNI